MSTWTKLASLALLATSVATPAFSDGPPQMQMASRSVRATVYPPDAAQGYYRGTRFDWSGVVANLEWNGHNYFGKWFDRYDPKLHDAIMGPVEEFLSDGAGLGYATAKPGETFVKIGVGVERKPDEPAYRQFATYEIVDNGKWTITHGADWITFEQKLTGPRGYAYVYRKTLRLAKDKPVLSIEHSLKNTGQTRIDSTVYEHNFYMLDGKPTGPDFSVTFPFPVKSTGDWHGLAETSGNRLTYLRELKTGETAMSELLGFGSQPSDYDIRVENSKTGAGVRQTSDRPIARIFFWSIRTTVCPEAYINLSIEPGQESKWQINYEFYQANR